MDNDAPSYEELKRRLEIAESAIEAIRKGEVDSILQENDGLAVRLLKAESQVLFQSHIIKNVRDSIVATDLSGKVTFWNKGAESVYGYAPEEIIGKSINRVIDSEDHEKINRRMYVLENGLWRGQYLQKRKNGESFWSDASISLIRDERGDTIGFVGIDRDITQQKNNEKEIIQQKAKAERYLNLAGVMFIGLNSSGSVEIANQKACNILEISQKDIIGLNWFDNFIPDDKTAYVKGIFKKLMNGEVEPIEYIEEKVKTWSGKEKDIAWHNSIIRSDRDKIIGTLSSGEDITEKRRLTAQLQQAQKMESIGNLAGGIAHEFNNVLGIILGNAELAIGRCSRLESGKGVFERNPDCFFQSKRSGPADPQFCSQNHDKPEAC